MTGQQGPRGLGNHQPQGLDAANVSLAVPPPSPVAEKTLEYVTRTQTQRSHMAGKDWDFSACVCRGWGGQTFEAVHAAEQTRTLLNRGRMGRRLHGTKVAWDSHATLEKRQQVHRAYRRAGTRPSAEPRGFRSTRFSTSNPWLPGNSVMGNRET